MKLPRNSFITSSTALVLAYSANALSDTNNSVAVADNNVDSLDTVVVEGIRKSDETEQTEQTKKLSRVPAMMSDPLQAVFSLPGIVQVNEAISLPAVRGSGPADNTFFIDSLPASFLFHSVLGYSIFNESLIRDFGVHAAGFGAQYGDATGAIFDISLREPRNQPLATTLESSFLIASALVEGGISENQAFYASYRESLIHLVLPTVDKKNQSGTDDVTFEKYPRSRDWQFKYTFTANDYNRISLLSLGAQDSVTADIGLNANAALVDPGSAGQTSILTKFNSEGIKWDYEHGASELHTALSNLRSEEMDTRGTQHEFIRVNSDDWQFKTRYAYTTHTDTFAVGAEQWLQKFNYAVHLRYRPCTAFSPDCTTNLGPLIDLDDHQIVRTSAVFAENTIRLLEPWTLTTGVRYAHNAYLKETHVEPRISTQWQLNTNWSLHASWGQYHQLPEIVELLQSVGNPSLRSPTAEHYVMGFNGTLGNGWSLSTDVYYKKLDKLAVDVTDDRHYINAASGDAYGIEFQVNKDLTERLKGWATLSLSRTKRHNDLTDTTFRYDFDTPIVANFVVDYDLGRHWDASARWNYRSGFPFTPIVGNKENPDFPGFFVPVYGELNSQRAHAYHRLDLHVGRTIVGKKYTRSYFVDIINAYGRQNGGGVVYKPIAGTSNYKLEETKSLPFIPSFGVKISF